MEEAAMVNGKNGPAIRAEAKDKVAELVARSTLFDPERETHYPRFNLREVELGRVLGRGGFCVVNEVRHVELKQRRASYSTIGNRGYDKEQEDRNFVKEHVLRQGDARYALKQLSEECRHDAHRYLKGVIDLAVEVKFLAILENPHIIKMRGVSDRDPFGDTGYFVLLDRLYDTLERRFFIWRQQKTGMNGLLLKMQGKKQDHIVTRLVVAYDLCSALLYLHDQRIIYRDLKPENIGFDVRDDVKIFDFGLAKELHPEDALEDDTYNLTGLTGSLRYMAPEVATWKPYNFTADAYSFGILLWQIMSLKQPFQGYNVNMHQELVIHKGYRPAIKSTWPLAWGVLMRNCWSAEKKDRPYFGEIAETLRAQICELRGDEDLALDQTRRSLHSLDGK